MATANMQKPCRLRARRRTASRSVDPHQREAAAAARCPTVVHGHGPSIATGGPERTHDRAAAPAAPAAPGRGRAPGEAGAGPATAWSGVGGPYIKDALSQYGINQA